MDYEKEYSPSQWVVRPTGNMDAVAYHYKTGRGQSDRVKHMKKSKALGPFLNDADNNVDIFTPLKADNDESMVFIFIPGGYWMARDPEAYHFVGDNVVFGARATYAQVNYQVHPKQSIKVQILAVAAAIKAISQERPNARALAMAGHSAGAHLLVAALSQLAETNELPAIPIRHIYTISGVYDLRPISKMSVGQVDLGGLSEDDAAAVSIQDDRFSHFLEAVKMQAEISRRKNEASATAYSTSVPCRVFSIVGEYESNEFKRQSKEFAKNISVTTKQSVDAEYMEIDGVDHFDIIESLFSPQFFLTRMMVRNCGGRLPSTSMGGSVGGW